MAVEPTGKTVLIAVDGSHHARHAFQFYLDELHRPSDTVLITLCIEFPYVPMEVRAEVRDRLLHDEQEKSQPAIDEYTRLLAENNLHGRVIADFGKPGEFIVKTATEEGAELIVSGTRGLGSIRRTILGSVSDYLVHHAHCPVVVCREEKKHK